MKTIYNAILEELKKNSKLKWIDLDTGQLEVPDRPGVSFPAVLVSIDIPDCNNFSRYAQNCKARITLRIAFDNTPARTSSGATTLVRDNSLKVYDTIAEVYSAMQGFETDQFNPLSRISQGKENSGNGLFIYRMIFECEFEDASAEQ